MSVHPLAIVDDGANIGENVEIGPFSIIGKDVTIGKGTKIDAHVRIEGPTEIGENCRVFQGAVLGFDPQDLKYKSGETTYLKIGGGNIIREYVTVHRATGEGNATVIGDNNFIMAYVHIGHNCILGSNILVSNATSFAGHVHIEDRAVVGGMTGVHQFVRIGRLAMVGGCARIVKDIPPYSMVTGSPAKFYGLNIIGLRRNGISAESRTEIKRAYAILNRKNRLDAIDEIVSTLSLDDEMNHLLEFLKAPSSRGICLRGGSGEKDEMML